MRISLSQAPFPPTRLVVDGLAVQRGGRRLVADLSFRLEGGQALVVTGPNGAGKSTLLRALAGLSAPAQGRARLAGPAGEEGPPAASAHYVGHLDGSKPALTARENLAFWQAMLALPGLPPAMTPGEALAALGAPQVADLPVAYLSAGQRRRVGLARLLLAPRPLWVLDEPLTALDAAGQALVIALMRAHLAAGGLVVAATHAPLGLEALDLALGGPAEAAA